MLLHIPTLSFWSFNNCISHITPDGFHLTPQKTPPYLKKVTSVHVSIRHSYHHVSPISDHWPGCLDILRVSPEQTVTKKSNFQLLDVATVQPQ